IRRDNDVRPLYSDPNYPTGRFNLDGIFVDDTAYGGDPGIGTRQYLQLYRNGIIESFDSLLLSYRPGPILPYPVERTLIDDTRRFLNLSERIGVSPPIAILVTVIGTTGRVLITSDQGYIGRDPAVVDRDLLPLPEIIIGEFAADTSQALRP